LDTWIAQKFVLDFDNSVGEFYYDDTLIHTWVLNQNANGTAGDNTINAIDFYATAIGTSANTSAYYDDIAVAEVVVVVETSLVSDDFEVYNTGSFDGQFH
jgi:aspartate ammonia-lyase|tara:strand:- start:169 stop:468 length:300 start_codon:yes stop_codon:yes gene_type:complete